MATFTTISRGKTNWQGPVAERANTDAYELLISPDYKLNIGSGYNLTISPEFVPTTWTPTTRTPQSFVAPATPRTADVLIVGGEYTLNIGSGYNLVIDPNQGGNRYWTNLQKS